MDYALSVFEKPRSAKLKNPVLRKECGTSWQYLLRVQCTYTTSKPISWLHLSEPTEWPRISHFLTEVVAQTVSSQRRSRSSLVRLCWCCVHSKTRSLRIEWKISSLEFQECSIQLHTNIYLRANTSSEQEMPTSKSYFPPRVLGLLLLDARAHNVYIYNFIMFTLLYAPFRFKEVCLFSSIALIDIICLAITYFRWSSFSSFIHNILTFLSFVD